MNEEKVISILRYFGVSRCRPIVSTYRMQKVFGLQWKTAKRWVRIMSALPQEDWSADRVHELHDKYVAIDEANGGFNEKRDANAVAVDLLRKRKIRLESRELEYDGPVSPQDAPFTDLNSGTVDRTSGTDSEPGIADRTSDAEDEALDSESYGYDPEGSLI